MFFSACARPFLPPGFAPYLAAFTTAGWLNIWNGHYGFLLGGLWLLFFRWFDERPCSAGAIAGLLTFKPHLGVMIAATAVRSRAVFFTAILTTAALVAVSALVFGADSWRLFLFETTAVQADILALPAFYTKMMPSPYIAFGRGLAGTLMQLVFASLTIAILWRCRKWDAFSAATATFLILPYAFNYDMTVVCLGFAILLYSHWGELSWLQRSGLMLAFLSPQLTFFLPQIVPFALLYAFAVQMRRPQSSDGAATGTVRQRPGSGSATPTA